MKTYMYSLVLCGFLGDERGEPSPGFCWYKSSAKYSLELHIFSVIQCSNPSILFLFQRGQTQSPPPPKPPSPSFELGLSSFPPLPGAAGNLKTEDLFENRLSSVVIGTSKERVSIGCSFMLGKQRIAYLLFSDLYMEKHVGLHCRKCS